MRTCHNNPLTVSNTKSLNYICGNFTFESLNLHRETFTLEKIVPQGLIRNEGLNSVGVINLKVLNGNIDDLSRQGRNEILGALLQYIKCTNRFSQN